MKILTKDQIQRTAPSVYATQKWHERSDRYNFVSTEKIIDALGNSGYLPTNVVQSNTRVKGKENFTRHRITFQNPEYRKDLLEVDDLIPEIGLVGSHDGSSCIEVFASVRRCWCDNQCTIAEGTISSIRVRHTGEENIGKAIIKAARRLSAQTPKVLEQIKSWKALELTEDQLQEFARLAVELSPSTIDHAPERLLNIRRYKDRGSDLWLVFNRVQENLIRGGVQGKSPSGQRRSTRKVTSIETDLKINRGLWALTEKFAKTLTPKYIEQLNVINSATYEQLVATQGYNFWK